MENRIAFLKVTIATALILYELILGAWQITKQCQKPSEITQSVA
jgi:hypothetical protein